MPTTSRRVSALAAVLITAIVPSAQAGPVVPGQVPWPPAGTRGTCVPYRGTATADVQRLPDSALLDEVAINGTGFETHAPDGTR